MAYKKIEAHDEYLNIVEQYKYYEAGTYKSMTLEEKINFFNGVHTNNIPLFDEDGDDMDTFDDYCEIKEEFLKHPEQFDLNNILDFMKMLDDNCYQPSFMDTIIKIIYNIVCFYQLNGLIYLLSHLNEIKSRKYINELFRYLTDDDHTYQLLKEAFTQISTNDRAFILKLLEGTNIPNF